MKHSSIDDDPTYLAIVYEVMPSPSHHNASLLLLNNLLSVQPGTSPFTLVQDTVEQSAIPLIRHIIHNALVSIAIVSHNPKYLGVGPRANRISVGI